VSSSLAIFYLLKDRGWNLSSHLTGVGELGSCRVRGIYRTAQHLALGLRGGGGLGSREGEKVSGGLGCSRFGSLSLLRPRVV
jgi:hypothetical protein